MFYSIRHLTRFRYSAPVSESIMELRMRPRHFNVPGKHTQLRIVAEAVMEVTAPPELPKSLPASAWDELDNTVAQGDYWEMLVPSQFARPSPALSALIAEFRIERREDPLTLVRDVRQSVYNGFEYAPKSTQVDSPIDQALEARRGVCQDFAHITIALLREVRIPCRYVSGYLYHRPKTRDRSANGATHAWVEALLPGLGWVGVDPTNNLFAGERHVRTAIGRDYADVPPTRGVFKGDAGSELAVAVTVAPADAPPPPENELTITQDWAAIAASDAEEAAQEQQQQ
jgi:transglutaminase-like putative cysteine protease